MEIEAIAASIDQALPAFAARGVAVAGYFGDEVPTWGWMFQFSSCWTFDDKIATVRVRLVSVAATEEHPAGIKVGGTADFGKLYDLPTVVDRWSHVMRYSDMQAMGILNLVEIELAQGADILSEATGRECKAEDRKAPY